MSMLNGSNLVKWSVAVAPIGLAALPILLASMTGCGWMFACGESQDSHIELEVYTVDASGSPLCPDSVTASAYLALGDDLPTDRQPYELTGLCDADCVCVISDDDSGNALEYEVTVTVGDETRTAYAQPQGGFECGMALSIEPITVVFE